MGAAGYGPAALIGDLISASSAMAEADTEVLFAPMVTQAVGGKFGLAILGAVHVIHYVLGRSKRRPYGFGGTTAASAPITAW